MNNNFIKITLNFSGKEVTREVVFSETANVPKKLDEVVTNMKVSGMTELLELLNKKREEIKIL